MVDGMSGDGAIVVEISPSETVKSVSLGDSKSSVELDMISVLIAGAAVEVVARHGD